MRLNKFTVRNRSNSRWLPVNGHFRANSNPGLRRSRLRLTRHAPSVRIPAPVILRDVPLDHFHSRPLKIRKVSARHAVRAVPQHVPEVDRNGARDPDILLEPVDEEVAEFVPENMAMAHRGAAGPAPE